MGTMRVSSSGPCRPAAGARPHEQQAPRAITATGHQATAALRTSSPSPGRQD